MCCRYYFSDHPSDEKIIKIVALMDRDFPGEYKTGEIFPGDTALAVIGQAGRLRHVPAEFGLPGFGGTKRIINARAETVAEKPVFAGAFHAQRAILPADGFYEWSRDGKKTKYLFTLDGLRTVYLCGIYKVIDGKYRFAILTRPANDSMRAVHDRMPVIVSADEVRPYLTDPDAAKRLLTAAAPMLQKEAVDRPLPNA